jgi:tight adherence protein C
MDASHLVALLVVLAAFASLTAGSAVLAGRERRRALLARAAGRVGLAPAEASPAGPLARLGAAVSGLATRIGDSVKPTDSSELSRTRLMLVQAGFGSVLRRGDGVAVYWGVKCSLVLLGLAGLVMAYPLLVHRLQPATAVTAGLAVTTLLLYLPSAWLRWRITARRNRIRNGLPDALDLLVVCVEAGMGLDAAIQRVAAEMRRTCPELSEELRTMTLELRAGKLRRDGLKNLALRIGLEDVNSLAALLIQADVFGTSVAQTLRVYSDAMRTKRSQRAEELAAQLPVKLLLPLIFFILPALFVVIMGPGALRLIKVLSSMK